MLNSIAVACYFMISTPSILLVWVLWYTASVHLSVGWIFLPIISIATAWSIDLRSAYVRLRLYLFSMICRDYCPYWTTGENSFVSSLFLKICGYCGLSFSFQLSVIWIIYLEFSKLLLYRICWSNIVSSLACYSSVCTGE